MIKQDELINKLDTLVNSEAKERFSSEISEIKTVIEDYFFLKRAITNISEHDNFSRETSHLLVEYATEVLSDLKEI